MERKNPKQLWLGDEVGILAEKVHRQYQAAYNANTTFRAFGNMIMQVGLASAVETMKDKKKRKRRRING